MPTTTKDAHLAAMLHEEMEDFLYLHFPPDYSFCAIGPTFRIPPKPLSDAAFAAVYEDLSTITADEKSGFHGFIKDKIYYVRRLLHHAMRVVDAEGEDHRVRLALNQHVWIHGGYTLAQVPWPWNGRHEINQHVDLMLSDRNTDTPVCSVLVRDGEGELRRWQDWWRDQSSLDTLMTSRHS